MSYHKQIKNARLDRGITGKHVAAMLAVSPATYYEIEAGRRSVTLERAEQIAAILGITLVELLRYRVSDKRTSVEDG